MAPRFCKKCGATLESSYKFCLMCGAPVSPDEPAAPSPASFFGPSAVGMGSAPAKALCKKCGAPLESSYKFCMVCGAPVEKTPAQPAVMAPPTPVSAAVRPAVSPAPVHASAAAQPAPSPVAVAQQRPVAPMSAKHAGFVDADESTTVLSEEPSGPKVMGIGDDEATTVLAPQIQVVLKRVSTGEKYTLHLPSVVGKGTAADVKIAGNTAISRKHLRVYSDYTIGGMPRVYIEDLGSLNKTRVDDRVLPQGMSQLVEDGARIKLADEEFVIDIREVNV